MSPRLAVVLYFGGLAAGVGYAVTGSQGLAFLACLLVLVALAGVRRHV